MKIRIFALAKELDMDSKLLIDFCSKAGIIVKNSALASISPEERDSVLDLIKAAQVSAPGSAAKTPTLARESAPAELVRPVRTIKTMTMAPRPAPQRVEAGDPQPESATAELDSDAPDQASDEPVVGEAAPTTPLESNSVSALPVATTTAEAAPTPDSPPGDRETVTTAAEAGTSTAPAPLRRPEYVNPGGVQRPMRTLAPAPMTARGTSDVTRSGLKQAKPRPSSMPQIAAVPDFKGPVSKVKKPEEEKAQKPEIRFTPGQTQQPDSPLAKHMHLGKATDKKKRTVEEEAEDRKGAIRRAGAGVGEKTGGTIESTEGGRAARRAERAKRQVFRPEDEEEGKLASGRRPLRHHRNAPGQTRLKTSAEITPPITVRTMSEAIGRPAKNILTLLFQRGQMTTINAALEEELAIELAMELGVDLQISRPQTLEEQVFEEADEADAPEDLRERPPIITILGHVDHGKTTLIDNLRRSNVAAGEHGGITQHIAAYQVNHNGRKLTFVDTPGHAAFGEMRSRGANVTDIVVLVVAANDGVMPQTIECIAHAKAANVPIVVALNKIDLPDKNEQKVLQELAAQNILASEWGGEVEVVRTSGLTGLGVPELLETLLLTAELHELKANPDREAVGTCLEAFRDEGRGPLAWVIVQKGTLKVGDVALCGTSYGRVRSLYNERDEELQEAGPSTPVMVAGFDIVPSPGSRFVVLDDIDVAREIAEQRRQTGRAETLATRGGRRTLQDILNAARDGQVQDLGLIIKADSPGSLEALRHEVSKFEHPEVRVRILHEGVGGVNESDVYLASASDAIIVAFHVVPEDRAAELADQEQVEIRRYNIIYKVIDDIRSTLEGMLRPEQKEIITGRAIVLQTFNISRFGSIAGCRVLNGTIERTNRIHLIRDQKILNSYPIASLRREKEDVKEVREGMECGIRLEGFNDIKEGDLLEAYRIEEVKRTLD